MNSSASEAMQTSLREVRALQVNYHALLSNSPDPVLLVDLDSGSLLDANDKAAGLFGLDEAALLTKRLAELCPERQPGGTDSESMLTGYFDSVANEPNRVFEIAFQHSSGRRIPCEIRMVVMPVAPRRLMHIRVIDVTRRKLDDALRVGQALILEMIARNAPLNETLDALMLLIEGQSEQLYCTVMLLDDDGVTMHSCSGPSLPKAFMDSLEGTHIGPQVGTCGTALYRRETVIVSDIRHDPLWEHYRDLVEPYGLRACWSTPIYLNRDHLLGTFAMYYREVHTPCDDDLRLIAAATHLAAIAIERTRRERELVLHREKLEELVAARTAELSSALNTLSLTQEELVRRDKLAALGALVAGVAHELNTPIGNSLVIATTMADQARSLEQDMATGLRRSRLESYLGRAGEAGEILARNLQRAAALVASFKQLAVDRTSSLRRSFSLDELINEIALPLRISSRQRDVEVAIELEPGLQMDSYPGPLSQVLSSLFDNCLVHAFEKDASGVIRIGANRRSDDSVAISVADNGAGIAPELLDRVYDPFFTTKLGSGGSGLGLHVAHNIVTGVLGGKIELQSEAGKGSTFTLVLPLRAPGALPAA